MKCVLKDCLNAQLGHNCFDAKHSLECCTKSSDMKCVVKDCLSAQLGHNCFNAKHSIPFRLGIGLYLALLHKTLTRTLEYTLYVA